MAYAGQGSDEGGTTTSSSHAALASASHGVTSGQVESFSDYHFSAFVAMETSVTVVPRFSMDRVECLGGSYGPFATNYPVEVPLWFALHLRQTESCTLNPPSYLRVDYLQAVLEREQASEGSFEPIPFYLFEIAKLFVDQGNEDVPQVAEVVRLLGDLKATRQRKLQLSMGVFEAEGSPMFIPGIKLTNLVSSELHMLRHSFAVVLQQASAMDRRRYRSSSTASSVIPPIAAPVTNQSALMMHHGAPSMTTTASDASVTLTPSTRLFSTTSLATTPARPHTRGAGSEGERGAAEEGEAGSVAGTQNILLSATPQHTGAEDGDATSRSSALAMSPSPSEAATTTLPLAPPAKRRRTLRQT